MNDLLFDTVENICFVNRPIPVPYNYRIMYKIAQLVLIMGLCCGSKGCSLEKLHMISMGLNSKKEMDRLILFVKGVSTDYTLIRFDPSINRAVSFAIPEKIIFRQGNGLLRLTPEGKRFFNEIKNDTQLLTLEKEYLNSIKDYLTEEKIHNIMVDWRTHDV